MTTPPTPATEIEQTNDQKIERLREILRVQHMKTLQNLLWDEKEAHKFLSSIVYSVNNAPKLLSCTVDSVISAFMKCAELQLYPSSVSGECYVIPYGTEAVFQLWYQWLVKLMARSGAIVVAANIVFEKDFWRYEEGLHFVLEHKPDIFAKDRGKAIGVYVVAQINGVRIPHVMGMDKVFEFRAMSAAYKNKKADSPWLSGKDPELWMWKKTCLKQLAKQLPKNETLTQAIAWDNDESVIARPEPQPKTIKAPDLSKFPLLTGDQAAAAMEQAPSIESTKTDAEDLQTAPAITAQVEITTIAPQKQQEQGKLPV